MTVTDKHYYTNKDGQMVTALHVTEPFDSYYYGDGKGAEGLKVDTIYAGTVDCSKVQVGNEIEVFYDKAVTTKNGSYSPVKKIQIVEPSTQAAYICQLNKLKNSSKVYQCGCGNKRASRYYG